ncbi:MAG: cyclic-di-AMP receptor [Anaerotruncus sp.]|nr:MAG: cyclic-di-AMP receptor [Anaerotruncus sp.]
MQQPVDVEEFGGVAFVVDVEEFKKFLIEAYVV